jgi:hypothetical protein
MMLARRSRRAPAVILLGFALVPAGAATLAGAADKDRSSGASAAAERGSASASPPAFAPDPAGHASATQWVFDLQVTQGVVSLTRARAVTLDRPEATARVMGRYAIELYVGRELLDRIRFDVPLTGDAPDKSPRRPFRRPTFDDRVTTRLRAQMADSPRATFVKLCDRRTGAEQRFAWPPEADGRLVATDAPPRAAGVAGTPSAAPDAGVPDAGDAGKATAP